MTAKPALVGLIIRGSFDMENEWLNTRSPGIDVLKVVRDDDGLHVLTAKEVEALTREGKLGTSFAASKKRIRTLLASVTIAEASEPEIRGRGGDRGG